MNKPCDSSSKGIRRALRRETLLAELSITSDQYEWLLSNHLIGHFKKAVETGVSFESFRKTHNSLKLQASVKSKTNKAKAVKESNPQKLDKFEYPLPDNLKGKLIPFSSDQWNQICNSPEILTALEILKKNSANPDTVVNPLVQSRGMMLQLLNGKEAVRYESTKDIQSHFFYEDVLKMAVKDGYMRDIELKFANNFGDMRSLPYQDWVENVYEMFGETKFTSKEEDHKLLKKAAMNVVKRIMTKAFEMYGQTDNEGRPVINLEFNSEDSLDIGIKPLSIEEAFTKVTKTGNSGWPFFSSKWSEVEELCQYYKNTAQAFKDGNYDFMSTYFVLFKRSQNKGATPKMRPVECPSKAEAIYSKTISDPLLNVLKEMPEFSGFKGGENFWQQLDDSLLDFENWISSDYSKFDLTIQELIDFVIFMLILMFPSERDNLLRLGQFYKYGGLITPQGIIQNKKHGLFSGCGLTSVIGTLCNALSHEYSFLKMYGESWRTKVKYFGYGDDTCFFTNEKFDPEIYSAYMSEIGLICNPSKQEITFGEKAYFSFLGFYYHREKYVKYGSWELVPTQPLMRLAPNLLWTEYKMNFGSVEKMISEAKELGVEDSIIKDFTENVKENSENMAFIAKFSLVANHLSCREFLGYMDDHMSIKIDAQRVLPFDNLMQLFRANRVSRNLGLIKQAMFRYIYEEQTEKDFFSLLQEIGKEDYIPHLQQKLITSFSEVELMKDVNYNQIENSQGDLPPMPERVDSNKEFNFRPNENFKSQDPIIKETYEDRISEDIMNLVHQTVFVDSVFEKKEEILCELFNRYLQVKLSSSEVKSPTVEEVTL